MKIRDRLLEKFHSPGYRKAYAESHLSAAIALQIKALRLQRGWSQERLAQESGLKQSQISSMEQTDFSSWTVRTLRKIGEAFDLPLLVKFPSWGDLLQDACSMSTADLERPSFEDDEVFSAAPVASNTTEVVCDVVSIADFRASRVVSCFPGADENQLASLSL